MPTAIAGPGDSERVVQQMAADIQRRHRNHLRELRIKVVEGGVILQGRALTFYGKQVALHEVRRRLVVVADRIEVVERPAEPVGGASRITSTNAAE